MHVKTLVLMLLGLVGAGCADGSVQVPMESPKSELIVRRVQPHGPIAIEGSVSFARIEDDDGSVVAEEGFDAPDHDTEAGTYGYPPELELQLEPGRYTIVSYQRSCDPSCDNLDPKSKEYTCRDSIEAEEGSTLVAEVRLGISGCTIEVTVGSA